MIPHKVIWTCKKHINEKYWTYLCSNCVKYFKHRNGNHFKSKFQNIKNLIKLYGIKYKIIKINKIEIFELQSLNLRQYYHKNILAFGDLLHKIHPLAGQGFNMTLRDIKILLNIIKNRLDLGLQIDNSINEDFEKKLKYKNLIFSSGIDLIHEFFNLESKIPNNILSKSTQFLGKNQSINRIFSKIADKGILS